MVVIEIVRVLDEGVYSGQEVRTQQLGEVLCFCWRGGLT